MLWWIAATAMAGSVYVNGVNVDALRDQTFKNVTVYIDAQGNVRVDAPQYQIEVVGTPPPPTRSAPVTALPPGGDAPKPARVDNGVPKSRWWLVTEDNDSGGHQVDLYVNGERVRTVSSGQPQLIEDIGPFLRIGTNDVRIVSNSVSPRGGSLYLYLGTGSNDSGTVVMDPPQVQFGVGASRAGTYERTYTLNVTP
jgi:hypothetical protein